MATPPVTQQSPDPPGVTFDAQALTEVTAATPVTAIVVVHRYDRDTTSRAVHSLATSEGVGLQVVLVYNGDVSDWRAVQELSAGRGATAIRSPQNDGFAAAVNLALEATTADRAIFLLNDDAEVEPQTIRRCIDVLAAHGARCVSVAPLVLHHDQPDRVDSLGVVVRPNGDGFNAFQGRWRQDVPQQPIDILGPCFSAALFRPGAFTDTQVGALSSRYFLYYEDVEWNIRARHRGFVSVTAPEATAMHRHALTTRTLGEAARFQLVQRNRLVMAVATLSWRGVSAVALAWLTEHLKGTVTGPYRVARVRAALDAIRLAPWAIRSRRHHRGDRPAADAALFAYSVGHRPAIDTDGYRLTP